MFICCLSSQCLVSRQKLSSFFFVSIHFIHSKKNYFLFGDVTYSSMLIRQTQVLLSFVSTLFSFFCCHSFRQTNKQTNQQTNKNKQTKIKTKYRRSLLIRRTNIFLFFSFISHTRICVIDS